MLYILAVCLCSIVTFLMLLDFYIKNYTTYKIAKSIQSPPMLPIIGSTQFLFSPQDKTYEIGMEFCKKFKNGFAYWSFGFFIYHIYSADSFEKVVTNPKNIEKSFSYRFLQLLLGTGLLTSTGEKWFARRKLLTPTFHFNILNGFQSTFNDQTEILLKEIREKELNNPDGTHLQKLISRFTLNTICGKICNNKNQIQVYQEMLMNGLLHPLESAMGVKLTKIDELDDYRGKINQIGKLQVERLTVPWMLFDWPYFTFGNGKLERSIIEQAQSFTGSVIATKRKTFILNQQRNQIENKCTAAESAFDNAKKQRLAMLDTLLAAEQNQKLIDSNGIQEEVDTFVFEGFDTTMTAITFILFAIANHETVQNRLYEEIASLDTNNNYNNLKYLDAVIKESLRLYPPVPFIGRILGEDTVLDGVKFPAKTYIHILINVLHRDPKYFPQPDDFDPNRFLDNDIKQPFAYVPFSAGQRNCIGQKFAMMELRTVIGEIIKNFELRPITKTKDVIIISDLILRSKDPIRVQFLPRCH